MQTTSKRARRGVSRNGIAAACAAFVATIASVAPSSAAAAPPPVEAFFKPAAMFHPVLSPDGNHVAVLAPNAKGHRQLVVIDANDLHKLNVAATFEDADIVNVHWVNDKRLVFSLGREDKSAWEQTRQGLFAVDLDGNEFTTLIRMPSANFETTHIKNRALAPDFFLLDTVRDGSDDVIVAHAEWAQDILSSVDPKRLNSRSAILDAADIGKVPDHILEWAFDSHGKAVGAISEHGNTSQLFVRDGDGWRAGADFKRFGVDAGQLDLVDVGGDGNLYVTASSGTADGASALFKVDLATGKPAAKPIVSLKGFDFDGWLENDLKRHTLTGIHYVNDAPGTAWLDADMRKVQEEVDAKLPGLANHLETAACGCSSHVLVTAMSDRQPAAFFLYDPASKSLVTIGGWALWIDAKQMADTDFSRIKTRDGKELPVYVTKPAGKGPFPAVVLVHGGPNVRGRDWTYEPEAQFLASRGYTVIEPEFRGSTGYGAEWTRAGFKQWGLKMDDDLVDAARWAATTGVADPKRVCLMGGSYGGYATLMALIKDPDVFRCGVASSAVTDISLMYDIQWSDATDDWKGYGMPETVGDRVKDAAQFDATSPLKLAAKLKQPLLLEHGGVDRRVPVEHAEKLRSAMLASGKTNLEWLRYDEEGHGLWKPENRIDFYTHVEAFLDKQIGPGSLPK